MINWQEADPTLAKSNTNTNEHPFTSVINGWLLASTGEGMLPNDDDGNYAGDDEFDEFYSSPSYPACNARYPSLELIQAAASSIP